MSEIPDDLLRELLQTFQVEAAEHIQSLNRSLLQIEKEEDDKRRRELVQESFRAAHSLKGAARAVDLHDIERLAHSIENVLQKARNTDTTIEPEVCDVLYAMLDNIQRLLEGQPSVDIAKLQARLDAVVSASSESTAIELHADTDAEMVSESDFDIEDLAVPVLTDETVRISLSKLDSLMAQTGELLVSKIGAEQRLNDTQAIRQQLTKWPRAWREIKSLLRHVNGEPGQRLRELLLQHYNYLQTVTRSFDTLEQSLSSDALRLGMITTDLQEDVRRTRMLPFQTIALVLERAVRDVARSGGKQVALSIEGSDIELDKKVLETLKDPLLHLLRNAVDHGIETPDARLAMGKPKQGVVKLTIRQRGNEVSLSVSDDGRGFDLDLLRQTDQVQVDRVPESNDPNDIISLAFLPGVTTSQQVTSISGRGVGLDIVRHRVEDIHGRIVVNNVPGKGVTIELIVPSSLAMTRGLIVYAGDGYFALPLLSIERIIEITETFSIGGKQMIKIGDTSLPLISLAAVLERPMSVNNKSTALAVIISVAEQRLALLVDEVLSELELAVKPLGEPLRRVRNVVGTALLGTGEPVVILNPGDLIRSARGARALEPLFVDSEQIKREAFGHILVVDDSITTRTLEKNILEAANYKVTIAVDGLEALQRLKEHAIDLVVTDLQMPNMDGIALTKSIRETAEHKHLPVILVTSLESQEDRERGLLAGADAYIVKRGFNQSTLLSTIQQFLERIV